MNSHTLMIVWLVVYIFIIVFLDFKFQLLRDSSTADNKPYSLSRVQLAWWMGFILCAFVALLFRNNNPGFSIPTFTDGIIIILGISSGTTAVATLTDVSDQSKKVLYRHQNDEAENFFLDILSDKDGPSVQRLQTVLFNIIFAVWFFLKVWNEEVMPNFDQNTLILLGLSSGTYAALKTVENKNQPAAPAGNQPAAADATTPNEIPPVR